MKRKFPSVEGARRADKMTGAAKLTEAHTRFIEAIADSVIDRVMPKGKKKRPKPDRRDSSG
jgi:hypothetical protein